jgi:DNA (cytosine-5)-methyltransferase 1
VDTTKEFTAIEWCAGYGGIHLGLKRAIPNLRVIAYGEIEGFACANLVAKMEAGLLDPAPLWTDIKTFPCEDFRDRVDLLVAGYPCQPFSAAGKRLGTEDPRHLWPHIARSIRVIRPRLCFFENVEGHISLGLREVIGELESIGYQTAWGIFSAAEVGAWHERRRVFILAADPKARRIQGSWADGKQGVVPLDWSPLFNALPSLPSPCLEVHRVRFAGECIDLDGSGEVLICPECKIDFADCACVGPSMDDDFDYQEDSTGKLTAHTKPEVHGGAYGLTDWVDRMRLLGNGVVPATAERAFRVLIEELI